MQYNDFTLLGLGILGVVLHSLLKINSLKKAGKPFSISAYVGAEWASMLISVIVVTIALICKHEVKSLDAAGSYLGLGFVTLGYMGQSILISFMGKAEKKLGLNNDSDATGTNQ